VLAREASTRMSVAAGEARMAGFKTLDLARLANFRAAVPIVGVSLAVLLWIASLGEIDPRAMNSLGLVTVLPPTYFAALLVLSASFIALVYRRPTSAPLLTTHVLALIAFLHATPAIVYGTLRYSWSWKHVGIVDYIVAHDGVSGAPGIEHLDVYHYWPSFFGLSALISELAGLSNAIDLATWAPVLNNVLFFGALLFLFSAMTRDKRVIWLGTWIFFIANWVGQDYYSPQAFAYFFYLVILGIALRWLRAPREERRTPVVLSTLAAPAEATDRRSRLRAWWEARRRDERFKRGLAVGFIVLCLLVITTSHALTSGMIILALAALVVARACSVRSLPLIAAGIVGLWGMLFASTYVLQEGVGVLQSIRLPWLQAEHTLASVGQQSEGQRLVTTLSRLLALGVGGLAALGALRQYRAGRLDRVPLILAGIPALLLAGGDYGGEILFRIYLFAVPFLAFLAAHALLPRTGAKVRSTWRPIASGAVCTALLAVFVVVYYGKEHQSYFTPKEVTAARYLYNHAPANSFLVDGTANYPRLFEHYDRFQYFTLSIEPRRSQRTFLAHPSSVLFDWMSDPDYPQSFLIITRGQKAEVSDEGTMPPHSLSRIERSLLRSPRFRVWYRNHDAIIFTLAGEEGRSA
jgi:hypothetical protein